MDVFFKDLEVFAGKKQILFKVSGCAQSGEILAILGPSGAGKTTLLNTLAGRRDMKEGSLTLDGVPFTKSLRRKICYVMQTDMFFKNLTLQETIWFTALLRLPEKMPQQLKKERVEQIIDILDLRKCYKTKICKLSGGEKKRTNIACELLTNPQVLFLDEPTSGLDAAIAFSVMKVLLEYCKKSGKTVVTTIHQPSSQIFHMFDNVMLMSSGKVAYFGKRGGILDMFSKIGLDCLPHYNPADFIMEKIKESSEIEETVISTFAQDRRQYVSPVVAKCVYDDDGSDDLQNSKRSSIFKLLRFSGKKKSRHRSLSMPIIEGGDTLKRDVEMGLDSSETDSLTDAKTDGHTCTDKKEEVKVNGEVAQGRRVDKVKSAGAEEECKKPLVTFIVGADGTSEALHDIPEDFSPSQEETSSATAETALDEKDEIDVDKYFDLKRKWPTGFWTQFSVLTHRTIKESRHRVFSTVRIAQTLALSIMAGVLWFQLPRTEQTMNDRMGVIFFYVTFWAFVPCFDIITAFPDERPVINRERSAGAYRLSAYYCAKMLSEIPLNLALPFVFFNIVYWLAGFAIDPVAYFASLGFLILGTITSQSIGICIGLGVETMSYSTTTAAVVILGCYLTGGYLTKNIPPWIAWLSIFSYLKYIFHAIVHMEFTRGGDLTCLPPDQTIFEDCAYFNATEVSGEEALIQLHMDFPLWLDFVALVLITIIMRIFGYIIIRYLKPPKL